MKSRLLTRRELDNLSEAGNIQALIADLARTPYRRPLEVALVHLVGREAVSRGVRAELEGTLARIHRFYDGDAGSNVELVLQVYDVHNLKAILRGLTSHATPGEIEAALLPVGQLTGDILAELARAANPRTAIDLLASMSLPSAIPLLRLRAERPGAGTLQMEVRLEQWYFEEAFARLQESRDETLAAALRLEADLTNVQTVLRLAAKPEEQDAIREWLGTDEVGSLLVGPGRIPLAMLVRAANRETVADALQLLAETAYAGPLQAALSVYRETGRLSSFERQLHRYRLDTFARLIARDPLGIGVVLGYLALKINEVNNLRWIANGIHLRMTPENIRAELMYAP